jgi:hypothetical protein
MGKREKVEENKFHKQCEAHGLIAIKMGTHGFYGANGYNDQLILAYPAWAGWFEFKREGGGGTTKTYAGKLQRYRHKQLKRLGFNTYVVYTAKEAWAIILKEVGAKNLSVGVDTLRPKAKRRRVFPRTRAR